MYIALQDVIMFLRAAHELIKQKRKAEESGEGKDEKRNKIIILFIS